MRFNKFIWELYRNSEQGQQQIKEWSLFADFPDDNFANDIDEDSIDILKETSLKKYINKSKLNWYKIYRDLFKSKKFSIDNARENFKKWISEGILLDGFEIVNKDDYREWTTNIDFYSSILYSLFPEYFFPYKFECEFFKFQRICEEFDIPLPTVPNKKKWEDRALYYIDLCDAIFEFRKVYGFKPYEFCAFLYDFATKFIEDQEDIELPNPSKVWFIGGNKIDFEFLDRATQNSISHWQCNLDAKRGDIAVMYCLSPRSYIHSIWRVVRDGFADPFFYYYNAAYVSNPIKLDVQITLNDLKSNPVWAINPLVKSNLQGLNGYPIKYTEYLELLSMLKSKGQNIDYLPTIKPTSKFEADDLSDERDVEIHLIEPLLELLNYKTTDWIRQMPIKMGRGERIYPDYCFGANTKRGEESAKMIIESKYEIKTQKDLQDAYFQAKSYALRLQSEKFVIAAKEGIWIFQLKNNNFKFEDSISYNWLDIENPDILHKLKQMIGKK
ncbi:MAG: hypothetical protein N2319_12010 [Candidatus Kapabacteria bacterium]|nr:hypothetical protein [Candidatus Kapabacteria bacterium]